MCPPPQKHIVHVTLPDNNAGHNVKLQNNSSSIMDLVLRLFCQLLFARSRMASVSTINASCLCDISCKTLPLKDSRGCQSHTLTI